MNYALRLPPGRPTSPTFTLREPFRIVADSDRESRKDKGGRPPGSTKFSEDRAQRMISLLEAGADINLAAAVGGITRSTLYDWLKQGARDQEAGLDTPFAQLLEDSTRARAESDIKDIAFIRAAGRPLRDDRGNVIRAGDWRALAWRLERSNPEYAMRGHLDVDVTEIEDTETDDDRRARILAQRFEAYAAPSLLTTTEAA